MLTEIEKAALSKIKTEGEMEPGRYTGTITVDVSYDLTVGEPTTATRRDTKGLDAFAQIAFAQLAPEQRAEVLAQFAEYRELKGKAQTAYLNEAAGYAVLEAFDATFQYETSSRRGAVKGEVTASVSGQTLVEQKFGAA